jgi:hypothetical protein
MNTLSPKRFVIARSTETDQIRSFDTNISKRFDELYEPQWEWLEDADSIKDAQERVNIIKEFREDKSTLYV